MNIKKLVSSQDELDVFIGDTYTTFTVTGESPSSGYKYADIVEVDPKEAVKLAQAILEKYSVQSGIATAIRYKYGSDSIGVE